MGWMCSKIGVVIMSTNFLKCETRALTSIAVRVKIHSSCICPLQLPRSHIKNTKTSKSRNFQYYIL